MGFAEDLKKICDRAGDKAELVVRRAALDLGGMMIEKSPVGNPDLWEINRRQVYMRETFNLFVEAFNADLGKKKGRLRKKGKKALQTDFGNKAGAGYTGGRFKNNWQFGIGSINKKTARKADPSGDGALSAGAAVLEGWNPGKAIFISNSLPYAYRLEHGWSKQSPSGMVRLSVQGFSQALAKAANEVK